MLPLCGCIYIISKPLSQVDRRSFSSHINTFDRRKRCQPAKLAQTRFSRCILFSDATHLVRVGNKRNALQPKPQCLPVNGQSNFAGHPRVPPQHPVQTRRSNFNALEIYSGIKLTTMCCLSINVHQLTFNWSVLVFGFRHCKTCKRIH